jgi:lysylphosphatidylglycerol synthetase-like protein (DUF2156 family)
MSDASTAVLVVIVAVCLLGVGAYQADGEQIWWGATLLLFLCASTFLWRSIIGWIVMIVWFIILWNTSHIISSIG